jgi:hypothetical protein
METKAGKIALIIIRWITGIFIALLGVGAIAGSSIAFIPFFLAAGLLLPPIAKIALKPIPYRIKRNYKAVAVIILMILGLSLAPKTASDSVQKTQPVQQVTIPQQTTKIIFSSPTPTLTPKPLTLDEKVKQALVGKIENPSIEIDDAIDPKTFDKIPEKKDITIDYSMGKDFWDLNAAKKSSLKNVVSIIKQIFPIDPIINSVVITAKIPTTDAYGKQKDDVMNVFTISRDTYSKIDFANFDYQNIPVIADTHFENKNIK